MGRGNSFFLNQIFSRINIWKYFFSKIKYNENKIFCIFYFKIYLKLRQAE